jgi:hypothetical protein
VGIPAKTRDHRGVRRLAAALGTILAGVVLGLACSHAGTFRCDSSADCKDGERQGVCTEVGWCAFEDQSCESDLAYGELAAPALAGTCVPVSGTGTSGVGSGSAVATSSSEGTPVTSDESGIQPPCPAGVGGPCEPEDPCAVGGLCDADGECVPTGVIVCNAPPGPCSSPQGQCQPDGSCEYPPLPAESECEDGDPCTLGDQCDGQGRCVAGPACPIVDECQVGECTDEGCAYAPLPDGTQCGEDAADRCCGGECVDISSDEDHCGGCNTACAVNQECEPVEATAECMDGPPETSGRCRCAMADDECPLGQICRTQLPYAGRCAPTGAAGCDGVFVEVQLCPNYCSY